MTTSDTEPDTGERAYASTVDGAGEGEFQRLAASVQLEEALVSLGTLLLSTPSMEAYLGRVADLAVQVFDPPATCGVSLYIDDTPVTVAASGAVAGQVEETQYEAGGGPCLHSMRTGESVDIPDLAADDRWPEYRTHAMALGLGSCHTVALSDGERTVGALNVHACEVDAFDDASRRSLRLFAAQTSAALELLRRDAPPAHARRAVAGGAGLAGRHRPGDGHRDVDPPVLRPTRLLVPAPHLAERQPQAARGRHRPGRRRRRRARTAGGGRGLASGPRR